MPFDLDAHHETQEQGAQTQGWRAELRCRFERQHERTVIVERAHRGPLLVQRAFYPELDGTCHTYLVHPPGGIVGGDRLRFEGSVGRDARALITSPAATKLYRSAGALAEQHTELRVARDGQLEWLPQETIIFSGTEAEITTRVDVEPGAAFLGWEIVCLGRPASGERFMHGRLRQRFEIWRGDTPLWLERSEYLGDDEALSEAWGLHTQPVFGTLVAVTDAADSMVESVRECLREVNAAGRCVVTALDHALVCRYIGPWAETARAHLIPAWKQVRRLTTGRAASVPRIWNT
jgi:urease accessory protein